MEPWRPIRRGWHPLMSEVTLADVEEAKQVLRGVVRETPLDRSRTFSELTSSEFYLKLENLQKTGSFKTRGAYVKISSLSAAERRRRSEERRVGKECRCRGGEDWLKRKEKYVE